MGKFADEEEKNNLFQNKGKRYVLQIVAEREMFVFEIYGAADSAAAARGGHFLVHVVITIFSSQTMSLIVEDSLRAGHLVPRHCFVTKQLKTTLFCSETLKYGTFCRETLKYGTFCREMLKYAL